MDTVRRHRTPGSEGRIKGFVTHGTISSMSFNIFVLLHVVFILYVVGQHFCPTWGGGERDATRSVNFQSCQDTLT